MNEKALALKEQGLIKKETNEENNLNGWARDTSGKLPEITEEQRQILFEPIKEADIEIRPDGLIYAPWMEYADRLNRAFPFQWDIIPQGKPRVVNNLVIWGFCLSIKGYYCGFAYGEQQWYENNPTMTWGDALEGAKSNALMRLCKGKGITNELWKPSFIKSWKDKHAESYWRYNKKKNKNELVWKKKDDNEEIISPETLDDQNDQPETTPEEEQKPPVPNKNLKNEIRRMIKEIRGGELAEMQAFLVGVTGGMYSTVKEIPMNKVEQIYEAVLQKYNEIKNIEKDTEEN